MDRCDTPKVLLLGISYPDVKGHMDKHGYSEKLLVHKKLSVDQAVELVRRGILTEMDARDLARCVATEKIGGGLEAYTVSKEVGGVYRSDRHVYANFNNSRGLYNALTQNFGFIQFQQVILDYYWMPTGWLVTRWAKSLFQNTLPDLVRFKMLAYPGSRSRGRQRRDSEIENIDNNVNDEEGDGDAQSEKKSIELEEGVVFLPFCAHVCKELVGAIQILKKYYAITFVHKDELPGHALWKGTMEIDANVMQHRLGKRLDQEEIYCTFQPKDIYGSMEDSHINKDDVMKMLLSIENFEQIRMIRLRPLRQHEPPSVFRDTVIEPEVGGFIGLNWEKGKQRFKEFRSRKKAPPPKQRKPRTVRSSEDSDSDTNSTSSSCSSDDDSSIGETEAIEMDKYCEETGAFIDIDFDPYDPEKVAETTNFYPTPTLDLVSYINGKEIIDDDNVMDSWAETWGPKASRKKNKKQDLLQNHYQKMKRELKGFMSCHSRLPDPDTEEEEGYKWTLSGDQGWTLDLIGDAPAWELIPKVVKGAKQDYAMLGSRYLFEMKNPGYKTLSRSYGYSSMISCYQIPKASVLCKIASAKEAERALQRISERQESTENVSEEHDMVDQESPSDETKDTVVPIDEMTIENVRDLNPQSLRKYLKSYGQKKIPHGSTLRRNLLVSLVEENRKQRQQKDPLFFLASVAAKENELSVQDSAALEHFADVALCTPSLPPEVTRIAKESIKMADIMVEDDLPPFAPSFQHLYFDLRGTSNFPTELYRLVQKAEALVLSHIISWQAKGKSFVVHDRDAFEQKILKECCDGDDSTYEGFGKNLRKFGFVEIQDGSRKGGFRHEYFRRKSHGDVALIEAVEEVPLDDFESGEELASTEQDAPKSSSKRKERRCPAAKAQNAQQLSGSKKFNLSGSDVFPVELHRLLENSKDQGLSNIIGWTPGGSVFAISDEEMFVKRVLARHSKKPLISSFEASLLAFGFKKTRKTSNDRRYQHPNFKKGRPELALLIKTIFEPVASSKKANAIPMTASEGKNRNGSERKRKRHPENDSNDSQKPAQPEAPLPFLGKRDFVDSLRLLLDMKTNSEYVKWLSDGSAFSVTDPDEFEKKVIPQYFKPMSYSSFRRELKALGFEQAGTGTQLKGIMYHGLFHRDFPDFWKLHDNEDLNEKLIYCLSLRLSSLADRSDESAPPAIDGTGAWLEFPQFQQFLTNSVRDHYELLSVTNPTKVQRELYTKLTEEVFSIISSNGFVGCESADEKVVLKCLRIFFRNHFLKARKELQTLKTVSETDDQRKTLQALIVEAQCKRGEEGDAAVERPEQIGQNPPESTKRTSDEACAATGVSDDGPGGLGDVSAESHKRDSSSPQWGSRKRKDSSARVRRSSLPKKNRPSGSRDGNRGCLSVVSPSSHTLNLPSPETYADMDTPPPKPINGLSQKLEPLSTEAVANPNIFGLLNTSGRGSTTLSHHPTLTLNGSVDTNSPFQLPESFGSTMNQVGRSSQDAIEEVSWQACIVTKFPVNVLSLYLLELPELLTDDGTNTEANLREVLANHHGLSVNDASRQSFSSKLIFLDINCRSALREEIVSWFGGICGPNNKEIEGMNRILCFLTQGQRCENLPEQMLRLEVYITFLRAIDGPFWLQKMSGMDLDARANHLFQRLMVHFMKTRFQRLLITSPEISEADRMVWLDFFQHCVCLQTQLGAASNSRVATATTVSPVPVDTNRNATTHATMLANLAALMPPSPNSFTQIGIINSAYSAL